MKQFLLNLLGERLVNLYHRFLSALAAAFYGYPSEKLLVIGVTGTNGKTTTANFAAKIFEESGRRVGLISTANFKIAEKERLNDIKMTMPGRFVLQRLLRQMVRAGCAVAVIETSSQGIVQHRHRHIHYDGLIFTNLTPEHIEAHGGFLNYKRAKLELFAHLERGSRKKIDGKSVPKTIVVNTADAHAADFLRFKVDNKIGYRANQSVRNESALRIAELQKELLAENIKTSADGSSFSVEGTAFNLKMLGLFNIENALAAAALAQPYGVSLSTSSAALSKVDGVPGRLEHIDEGQDFIAIVDYAPEPASLAKSYEALAMLPHKRLIHLLGSAGGGRDKARRPILGSMAGKAADIVIVTNEDPYDENPLSIMEEVATGALKAGKIKDKNLFIIPDRREAVRFAINQAKSGDLILFTGKGSEQAIVIEGGKKIQWDERNEVRQAIKLAQNAKRKM